MARLRDSYSTQGSANELAQAVQSWLENSDPTVLFRTCYTCNHCNRKTAVCNKFGVVPPVAIIAGHQVCDTYQDGEDIPF